MNGFALAASVAMIGTGFIHIFLGGRKIVAPLMACTSLPPYVKATHYFVWHGVTGGLFAWGGALAYFSTQEGSGSHLPLILLGVAALAIALLNLIIGWRQTATVWKLPQWTFFLIVGALTLLGAP